MEVWLPMNLSTQKEASEGLKKHNIPIYHETHSGRFSYFLTETLKYLKSNSEFRLTLDVSHWMVVHESLLQKQEGTL